MKSIRGTEAVTLKCDFHFIGEPREPQALSFADLRIGFADFYRNGPSLAPCCSSPVSGQIGILVFNRIDPVYRRSGLPYNRARADAGILNWGLQLVKESYQDLFGYLVRIA